MLPPLDTRKLGALLRDDDEEGELECDPRGHISIVKELIAEDRNWSEGVMTLLELWPRTNPRFYRKKPLSPRHPLYRKGGPNDWWIELNDAFFGSLHLKPRSGGVIDIYALEKRVESFQIMGCRRNWVAMISWIWDYANRLEAVKSKRKGGSLLTLTCFASVNAVVASFPPVRAHGQRRRVEKPLLHKVLHTAKFKAKHGTMPKANDVAVVSETTDLEMENVDATLCNTASDTANSSGHVGLALQTMATSDDQRTPDAMVEGIEIGALEVVDHKS